MPPWFAIWSYNHSVRSSRGTRSWRQRRDWKGGLALCRRLEYASSSRRLNSPSVTTSSSLSKRIHPEFLLQWPSDFERAISIPVVFILSVGFAFGFVSPKGQYITDSMPSTFSFVLFEAFNLALWLDNKCCKITTVHIQYYPAILVIFLIILLFCETSASAVGPRTTDECAGGEAGFARICNTVRADYCMRDARRRSAWVVKLHLNTLYFLLLCMFLRLSFIPIQSCFVSRCFS